VVGNKIHVVGGRYWDISEDDYIFLNDIQILDTAPRSSFSSDWRQYFNNAHLSDIELRVEGRSIPAHRVVLAARCDHFSRMLLSGMKEAQAGEVEITGIRHEVFMAMLEYLYTDQMDFTPDIALELLSAADRFGLDRLKRECISLIETALRTSTVCHVLSVADQHSAQDLKEVCLNFITSNFPEVIRTEGFQGLQREHLDQVHFAMANRHYPDKEAKLETVEKQEANDKPGHSSPGEDARASMAARMQGMSLGDGPILPRGVSDRSPERGSPHGSLHYARRPADDG